MFVHEGQPEHAPIPPDAKSTELSERTPTILVGDAREVVKSLPSNQFRCCVTYPPYWGLRDYEVDGQIGAEDDVNEFVRGLVDLFREIRRTLTDDGTLWLNIGDSFTSGGRTWRDADKKNPARGMGYKGRMSLTAGSPKRQSDYSRY